jgi:hypothetical protein
VVLVAVSKTRGLEEVREAIGAGVTDLGENYVQELVVKWESVGSSSVQWHMIGHLQRNKAKYLAPFCSMVHAMDSERLAEEISRRAAEHGRRQPVLIEVNIAGEETKFGVSPGEVAPLAERVVGLAGVELRGLMTMTPYAAEREASRRHFTGVRELAERVGRNLPPGAMSELSMGMTQDFEVAVEEGATIVRVGTAIFGRREG